MWELGKMVNPLGGGTPTAPNCGFEGGSVNTANTRARPTVANGTFKTDTGTLLRGGTMYLGTQTNPVSSNNTTWVNWRNAGLNVCRFDVKTTQGGRPPAQQFPYIDAAVSRAEANRMYLMLLHSVAAGTYNRAASLDFWGQASARYANRPCVLFEWANEPTSWGQVNTWNNTVLTDMHDVYTTMRGGAPNTHILLFCSASLYGTAAEYITLVNNLDAKGAIDWTKTGFAYHHYPNTYNFTGTGTGIYGFKGINQLGTRCPVVMTESNDFMGDTPSNDTRNKTLVWIEYERNNKSWVCLDGKSGAINTQITSEIIPAIANAGFPIPHE